MGPIIPTTMSLIFGLGRGESGGGSFSFLYRHVGGLPRIKLCVRLALI